MKRVLFFIGALTYYFGKALSLAQAGYLQRRYERGGLKITLNGVGCITDLEKVECGMNVHLGDGYYINSAGGVEIGDNVHISRNLTLYSTSHNYNGAALPYDDTLLERKVVIEKNVWIGMNVTIVPGAYLEEGCIIGAGAVVCGRVAKGAVFGAAPAAQIKQRDMSHYYELEGRGSYGGSNGVLIK